MIKYVGKASRFESEQIKMVHTSMLPQKAKSTTYCCVGFDEKTIYVTKKFHEKAMKAGTIEAKSLYRLNLQFPNFVMKELV